MTLVRLHGAANGNDSLPALIEITYANEIQEMHRGNTRETGNRSGKENQFETGIFTFLPEEIERRTTESENHHGMWLGKL